MSAEGPLDIEVRGDVASCRATAHWLATVSHSMHDAGSELHRSRSESESTWQGHAGDAFRDRISETSKAADDFAQRADELGEALESFSGTIESIKRQLADLSHMAIGAGLTATEFQIMPPGPQPGGAPVQPPSGASEGAVQQYEQQQSAFATAYSAHQKKAEAFAEATTTVAQLREREREAHQTLGDVVRQEHFLEKQGVSILSKATTSVATAQTIVDESIKDLTTRINDYDTELKLSQEDISANRLTARGSAFTTEAAAIQSSRSQAAEKLADMQRTATATKSMGGSILSANPGSLIPEEATSSLGQTARGIGKKLPYVGTAITVGGATKGIADGKPAAKEVEKAVGGTAASIASGAAVGTMVGGPVGTVVGAGAGMIASYGVENLVDWKNGPIEQANRSLGIE